MDKTTAIATAKIIIAGLGMVIAFFGHSIPPEVKDAMLGFVGSGYLIFSWLQGFFTKDKGKEDGTE